MKPKIIAEIAQGYEGRADYVDYYVRAAHKAGADAVKFQVVYADDTAEPGYEYYDFYKQLEMDIDVWKQARELARELGLLFFTDISGNRALDVARQIVPDGIKIHSSNFFNRELIQSAFTVTDKVLLSLGGVTVEEIESLVQQIESWGKPRSSLILLYGFQAEPTAVELTRLARIPLLQNRFEEIEIGFMDHAPGDSPEREQISIMAMMTGVDWIEKHLTIDRFMEVEDYLSALQPAEFAQYVKTLDNLSAAIGAPDLTLTDAEEKYRDRAVKKLITSHAVEADTALTLDDITFKRTARIQPGDGFHDPSEVVGRIVKSKLEAGAPILGENLK